MTERRAVLTVDLECKRCGGSGAVAYRTLRPGAQRRYGGTSPTITGTRRCDCVEPREVQVIHDPWHQPEAILREPEEPTHE